jgi:phage minor structural protein
MAYQVWVFTAAGVKTAYLENAYDIQRSVKANQTPTLSFSLPADDAKADYITSAYEVKIWNTVKARWEGLYILDDAEERWGGSGSIITANYSGVMGQLVQEDNITYDTTATPKTPTQIITALLALQENAAPITVGTIQPTTSFAFAVENANLLGAVLKCAEYLGGYIEVDSSRALNWYNEPSGDPVREIRYRKNLRGVSRKRDFTTIINKIYAYGFGETEAQVTLVDAGEAHEYIEDGTSQTAYGVRIKRMTDKRITHPSTLLLWAQRILALYKDPVYYYEVDVVNLAEHPDFTFDLENLEVGQIVRVVNSDLNDLNVNVKIVSVSTQLDRPENITLELANATKTLADSIGSVQIKTSLAENIAVQIGAGQVSVLGTFTVEDWASEGVTTIDGGNITTNTITADAIKTSTLNAKTITLGTTGGDSIIKSGNYSAGSAGWQIKANGDAEFNNVTVRGTIGTASIGTGSTITVSGNIRSSNFNSSTDTGWLIYGDGSAIVARQFQAMDNIIVDGEINTKQITVETSPHIQLWNESTWCELYVSGNNLMFKNGVGTYTITMS